MDVNELLVSTCWDIFELELKTLSLQCYVYSFCRIMQEMLSLTKGNAKSCSDSSSRWRKRWSSLPYFQPIYGRIQSEKRKYLGRNCWNAGYQEKARVKIEEVGSADSGDQGVGGSQSPNRARTDSSFSSGSAGTDTLEIDFDESVQVKATELLIY